MRACLDLRYHVYTVCCMLYIKLNALLSWGKPCIYVCKNLSLCIFITFSVCVRVRLCMHTWMRMCVCVVCVCVCVCVYIYIYIYIYTYIVSMCVCVVVLTVLSSCPPFRRASCCLRKADICAALTPWPLLMAILFSARKSRPGCEAAFGLQYSCMYVKASV